MEKDETYVIQLRDCFTGGYTLPQYCIDNGIKKPLFVSEEKFLQFMWEIYTQFRYDKKMNAQFSVLDMPTGEINFSVHAILAPLRYRKFSEVNPGDFDAIILLTTKDVNVGGRVIRFEALTDYFIHKTYAEIPLLKFSQRYPRVKLILTKFPDSIWRYKDAREFMGQVKYIAEMVTLLRNDKSGNVKTSLDKFGYTNQEFSILMAAPPIEMKSDGSTIMRDDPNPLMRIKNGKRETAYQPTNFKNKIYFAGSCHDFGVHAPFDKTIESYLQKMLNEHNLSYRVENESQRYFCRYQDIFYNLNKLTPAPGDIIFVWLDNMSVESFPFLDLSDAFDPPHDYKECYCTRWHVNELGYKILAERYFKYLTENNFFRDKDFNYPAPPPVYHRYGIPPQFESGDIKTSYGAELETYKQSLRAKKLPVGAIVMNCNPFTLGHQYLVEYAAAKVARLYIFVVEEDRSEFPFKDRIELVRQGVKHIPNVEVLPSGKFIISQQTFSGYFNKAELQDVTVDSSEDVEIFAKEIAPTLGITIRFAGEEPTDNVTRQYNETMKRILPRYGIEFCEIPRKTFSEEIISASKVREALKVGDFDKIKQFVPETTLNYLRKRYF
jgi:[citrate (pro-3S)-lyase] ligase